MGAGHGHGIDAAGTSASGRHVRRLAISLGVLLASLVLQVVVGLMTSSLALLSDAGHNFTDVLGMGMALAAIAAARASRSDDRRTFGLYRAEVLAALANAVLLFGVAGWVLLEAVQRFADPPEVPGLPIVLTAVVGLAANLFVFALLRRGAKESINIRGAYLEVIADTLGSLGVLLAGVVTLVFGWRHADPIVAIGIGLFILPRTWSLGRQAVRILVQAAPAHVDVAAVRAELAALEGVQDVHDVHVWTLTSGMEVGSAHLTIGAACDPAEVLTSAQRLLTERHALAHFTVQVEPPGCRTGCAELSW
ncbi:cation diffusion facilitator family transporter [Pseudonocardia hierapolitana]|nr:cation diffusion facilitator family transporter [Pseudonocardia hierapolitana]